MRGRFVLVIGAAGGGPGLAGGRIAGLLLDRGVRCVPSFRRKTTVLSTFGRPAPRWPPGDPREIADVEPGPLYTREEFLDEFVHPDDRPALEEARQKRVLRSAPRP